MAKFKPLLLIAAFALCALAQAGPPPADAVLKDAQAVAKKEGKNVLVIFHASWCGWCKKLDGFLADKAMKPIVEKALVVVHLTVLESPDKKADENPGGGDLMKRLGGDKAGLPFMAILDPAGKMVINSIAKEGNTGYPAAPGEIAHFLTMLEKGTKIPAADRTKIGAWLEANAPKPR